MTLGQSANDYDTDADLAIPNMKDRNWETKQGEQRTLMIGATNAHRQGTTRKNTRKTKRKSYMPPRPKQHDQWRKGRINQAATHGHAPDAQGGPP